MGGLSPGQKCAGDGARRCREQAFRDNGIDAAVVPKVTADNLIRLGIASIGHRRQTLAAIANRNQLVCNSSLLRTTIEAGSEPLPA